MPPVLWNPRQWFDKYIVLTDYFLLSNLVGCCIPLFICVWCSVDVVSHRDWSTDCRTGIITRRFYRPPAYRRRSYAGLLGWSLCLMAPRHYCYLALFMPRYPICLGWCRILSTADDIFITLPASRWAFVLFALLAYASGFSYLWLLRCRPQIDELSGDICSCHGAIYYSCLPHHRWFTCLAWSVNGSRWTPIWPIRLLCALCMMHYYYWDFMPLGWWIRFAYPKMLLVEITSTYDWHITCHLLYIHAVYPWLSLIDR